MANLDKIQKDLLAAVADLHTMPEGAYSLRVNGKMAEKRSSEHIEIVKKEDKAGIDIYIKPGTKNESVHIPVLLSESGLSELVYNDFHVGKDCDVTIVAGCGIHNCGVQDSEHSGIHTFFVGKNARIRYVEKHYGEGDGEGKNLMNPSTIVYLEEGAEMTMEATQIKGVDSTYRKTAATLAAGATLTVNEKIMTHGKQNATTDFTVDLTGPGSGAHVVSRSVASGNSHQHFRSLVRGNAPCMGHTECDAIILENGTVSAEPQIEANHPEATLIHEAAIGKIAGEQLTKLMTLGLTEKEAEAEIISGFLK